MPKYFSGFHSKLSPAIRGAGGLAAVIGCVIVADAIALQGCATGSTLEGTGGSGGSSSDGAPGPGSTSSSTGTGSTSSSAAQTTGQGTQTVGSSSSSGTPCTESPCKLTSPQCGCPATDGCTVDATGTHLCAAAGTATTGQLCSAANNCVAGDICLGATVGTCFTFCAADNECVGPGGHCLLKLNDGMGGTLPNITMCSQNCDPALATSCNVTGVSCQIATDMTTNVTFTSCYDAGTAGLGAACPNGSGDCQVGLGCFTVGTANQCLQWCKVGVSVCPGVQSCLSLNPQLFLGATEYGVCN